jgi:FkbM family methyltransferase
VVAFEPHPVNVQTLHHALSLSQYKNIEIIPKAVADKPGILRFAAPTTAHKSGMGFLVMGEAVDANVIEVESISLSSMQLGRAALIHIDAEGAEYVIVQGAVDYLKEYSSALILEADPHHLERAGATIADLFALLTSLGYVIFGIERLGLTRITDGNAQQSGNWLCLPAEKANLSDNIAQFIRQCSLIPAIKGVTPLTRGL